MTTTLPMVRDNAAYAWRNCQQECLAQLSDDFVYDYRELLDMAAIAAMETALVEAWRAAGFEVRLVSGRELEGTRDVPDETYWAAWDKAAESIDPWALVEVARLDDEMRRYSDD